MGWTVIGTAIDRSDLANLVFREKRVFWPNKREEFGPRDKCLSHFLSVQPHERRWL